MKGILEMEEGDKRKETEIYIISHSSEPYYLKCKPVSVRLKHQRRFKTSRFGKDMTNASSNPARVNQVCDRFRDFKGTKF